MDTEKPTTSPSVDETKVTLTWEHMKQRHSWDCGIASGAMAMCWLTGRPVFDCYEALASKIPTQSVWSIEIAKAMHETKETCLLFLSSYIGISDFARNSSFYSRELDEDEARLPAVVQGCIEQGLPLLERRLFLTALIDVVSQGLKAVVLVDRRKLHCTTCTNMLTRGLRAVVPSFYGHFVVLNGYDAETNCFTGLDPAVTHKECTFTAQDVEISRTADGTDEDIIIFGPTSTRALVTKLYKDWSPVVRAPKPTEEGKSGGGENTTSAPQFDILKDLNKQDKQDKDK